MDIVPVVALCCCLVLLPSWAYGLGSMASIAVSYGEDGPVFCGLNSDGSHLVTCFGADASVVYGAPSRIPFVGVTAGDGFACGLLLDTNQPYCWGSNSYVKIGVPQPMVEGAMYSELSAGDNHLCALRTSVKGFHSVNGDTSVIDCWGYNMTATHTVTGAVSAISAGSVFNCGLFARNRTVFCWGDESVSGVIGLAPRNVRFQSIGAGGYHVCGVLENAQVFCWGRSLEMQQMSTPSSTDDGDVNIVPMDAMVSVVGGRFHACGIRSLDHQVACWGFTLQNSTLAPKGLRVYAIVAGDYFTCGVPAETSLKPMCWGHSGPLALPMAVSPGICVSDSCSHGYYEYANHGEVGSGSKTCKPANSRLCLPCSVGCPDDSYESSPCNATADRVCQFDCSKCASDECVSFCLSQKRTKNRKFMAFQLRIFVAEIAFAVILVFSVTAIACLYVRYKLRHCQCSKNELRLAKNTTYSFRKDNMKIQPDVEDLKIRRAQEFSYEELEQATGGFSEDSQVGKGSFSYVKKSSKEFHTELDLLSRLNHAHLLNLLGYCEDGSERLLVYEFMAHGSLYQHLHGKDPNLKKRLNWARRVTIAVQAARGIEYLHGYACPPCWLPDDSYESSPCNATADRVCQFDCSKCASDECVSFCLSQKRTKNRKFMAFQLRIFVAEIAFAVILVFSVTAIACLYVRYKLRHCQCSKNELRLAKNTTYSFRKDNMKIQPDVEDLKIRRAQEFSYEELEQATGGFSEDSQVGKGSFSCVFKGILRDGTVVAVKRAIKASDVKKSSKEFHTELDLLSRLNHAHLLNLLGYCEDGSERLLVYEFMAHGSLYQHLHGKDPNLKKRLNWARRDHNARFSDFGLSKLGPADCCTPLSELPAGTLGYLDPEYYRLHYLTTKSDVYSFGVVLLEILSGRKAIDMQFEEGNIVEWAVPLIKAGDISALLDPVLSPPSDLEALKKIAAVACKCVRMRAKDRPSMDKVTTALERALALLMGSPCIEQPILPTEVVLGSSRMHKKVSQRSSNHSCSENDLVDGDDQRIEYRAPSWITFPSVTSSQRRKSSASEADMDGRTTTDGRNVGSSIGDGLRSLEEEISPASPQENLYLQHNF
ncbi:hypothetical protein OsJ_11840 [Oryza sativa Japonica Group]|uniref:non-specific serine/threonine protein kinase n=1 Tax=Oryza sativa subsp. japonica TaxID=39947 RepID=B9F9V8_ORYSJ|nr:hypothetical protein OsJ_11840 [Oryza sativa Japonica Group]